MILEQKEINGVSALYWNAPARHEADCPVCFSSKKAALAFKKDHHLIADAVRVHNRFWRGWVLTFHQEVLTYGDFSFSVINQ